MTVGVTDPVPSFVAERPGAAICVIVRLSNALLVVEHEGVQPGRNSVTVPRTRTRSPTATAFATSDPNTRMPSEVAGSVSGSGSWSQTLEPRSVIRTAIT